jgi:excreted virulence factor EspC (type VII ESX diderm)
MFADTDAVRAFGSANSAHAADLGTVATALLSMPDLGPMVGPVGAGFLAALTEATTEASRAAAALADRLEVGCRAARFAAAAYDNADQRAGIRVAGVH